MIDPIAGGKPKSKGVAFALAFLFGPLGLFYVLKPGVVIAAFVGAVGLAVLTGGLAAIAIALGVCIYAPIAAGEYNERLAVMNAGSSVNKALAVAR